MYVYQCLSMYVCIRFSLFATVDGAFLDAFQYDFFINLLHANEKDEENNLKYTFICVLCASNQNYYKCFLPSTNVVAAAAAITTSARALSPNSNIECNITLKMEAHTKAIFSDAFYFPYEFGKNELRCQILDRKRSFVNSVAK